MVTSRARLTANNKKLLAYVTLLLFSVGIIFPVHSQNYTNIPAKIQIETPAQTVEFSVEVANDPVSRATGLMYRNSLPIDQGMLFILEEPEIATMWMRNTYIPLDIIFIGEDMLIKHIVSNTTPRSEKIISSKEKVKFILEVNAGLSNKYVINKGYKVIYGTNSEDTREINRN